MPKVKFEASLIQSAVKGDKQSVATMFQSFIGNNEQIVDACYFGKYGFLFSKVRSFVCVTDKRVAAIKYGRFGQILYQDAFIEDVNSGFIYQPSLFRLYFVAVALACTLFGIVLIPAWVRMFYMVNKSGMVWAVREGVSIYAFANRSRIHEVNKFWRRVAQLRSLRVQSLKR